MQDLKITRMGLAGYLADAAQGRFSDEVQGRIHAMADRLRGRAGVAEVVPGMNNLLVEVVPAQWAPGAVEALLHSLWQTAVPAIQAGKTVEIPVVYGGEEAEDLHPWAAHAGLPVAEAVARHAAAVYTVAAIGAMPGFGYLSGLDPQLAMPRRKVPRGRVPEGAVIVGGAQAAVMPVTAPSGWHIIGWTHLRLFDATAAEPCLLAPGDRVRFVREDLRA